MSIGGTSEEIKHGFIRNERLHYLEYLCMISQLSTGP